jgi:hypothetical protein
VPDRSGATDGSGVTDGSGGRSAVLVGTGGSVGLTDGTGAVVEGGVVFGAFVAGADVARGDDVVTGATADARGLGAVVAADPDDGAGLVVAAPCTGAPPGADGNALTAGLGNAGKSPIIRPSSVSLLTLNAARASATAIDGPSNTYSAKDVRPADAFSRLPESPTFPPIPRFVYGCWLLIKLRSRRNRFVRIESTVAREANLHSFSRGHR